MATDEQVGVGTRQESLGASGGLGRMVKPREESVGLKAGTEAE